jgi:cytidine deaminase
MRRAAMEVRENAYAPYSKYKVGAAILTADNRLYTGCNVETANYDCTHGEESALAAMVADGNRSPKYLLVVGGLEGADHVSSAAPCGKCRQRLMEFASLSGYDLTIFVVKGIHEYGKVRISELLPDSFGPADVGVDLNRYKR